MVFYYASSLRCCFISLRSSGFYPRLGLLISRFILLRISLPDMVWLVLVSNRVIRLTDCSVASVTAPVIELPTCVDFV